MQVTLGRRDARVAHRRLHGREVDAAGDQLRTVRVPQVVEAQRREAGGVTGALDTPAQRRAVEAASEPVGEDIVVGAREVVALGQAVKRACRRPTAAAVS